MYLVNISIQSWGVLKGTLKIQKMKSKQLKKPEPMKDEVET